MRNKIDIWFAPHEIIRKNIENFIKRYIHQHCCRFWHSKIVNNFDAIVVGSDQIWRPKYSRPIEHAFLSFIRDSNIKRIAYAASFGVDFCEYSEKQLAICSSLLKKFDAVSVREDSGIYLCESYFGVKAVQMLDPTLLLSEEDYRDLIVKGENTKPSNGNLLVYILDKTQEKISLVEKIAKEKKMTPFWLDNQDEYRDDFEIEKQVKMPVEQWLRSFDEAEFVFTDSFHGCIFSIIFRKQFLVFGNRKRGLSRFNSLLNLFSLNERLIISANEYLHNSSPIDFDVVYKKLDSLRKQSYKFIKTELRK